MGSLLSIGVSFLLFFVVTGFLWLIGTNIIAQILTSLPGLQPGTAWGDTFSSVENEIKLIVTWTPGILLLFASIKMLVSASSRGAD